MKPEPEYARETYATGFIAFEHKGKVYEVANNVPDDELIEAGLPKSALPALLEQRKQMNRSAKALAKSMRMANA